VTIHPDIFVTTNEEHNRLVSAIARAVQYHINDLVLEYINPVRGEFQLCGFWDSETSAWVNDPDTGTPILFYTNTLPETLLQWLGVNAQLDTVNIRNYPDGGT